MLGFCTYFSISTLAAHDALRLRQSTLLTVSLPSFYSNVKGRWTHTYLLANFVLKIDQLLNNCVGCYSTQRWRAWVSVNAELPSVGSCRKNVATQEGIVNSPPIPSTFSVAAHDFRRQRMMSDASWGSIITGFSNVEPYGIHMLNRRNTC